MSGCLYTHGDFLPLAWKLGVREKQLFEIISQETQPKIYHPDIKDVSDWVNELGVHSNSRIILVSMLT